MDPVSGFSLACNILQVVHVTGKLVSTAQKLSRSPDGVLPENLAIENVSADLIKSMESLMSLEIIKDESLQKLGKYSRCYAQDILEALGKARIEGEGSKWKVLKKSSRSVWMESDIKRMQENLGHLKLQLTTHMTTYLVSQNDSLQRALYSMTEKMQNIDDKLEELRDLETLLASEKVRQRTRTQESWTVREIELDTTSQMAPNHPQETSTDKPTSNPVSKPGKDGVPETIQLTLRNNSTSKSMLVSSTSSRSSGMSSTANGNHANNSFQNNAPVVSYEGGSDSDLGGSSAKPSRQRVPHINQPLCHICGVCGQRYLTHAGFRPHLELTSHY